MAVNQADLHTHTTASDGTETPAHNVRLAKKTGLAAIAITDHDTMAGVPEALVEGKRLGITVVPGVEISTSYNGSDIHILGYYADWNNVEWMERLQSLRDVRENRNEMIVEKLYSLGLPITMDEIRKVAGKDGKGEETIGRPHIAQVLIEKHYVQSMAEAFDRYLGTGAAAYLAPPRLHPFEALEWIREAGGTSVIAHPGLYGDDDFVEQLIRKGAQGLEVFHSDHGPDEEERYGRLADRYRLIVTGGSDFHGERGGVVFHGPIGSKSVDAAVIRRLNPVWRSEG